MFYHVLRLQWSKQCSVGVLTNEAGERTEKQSYAHFSNKVSVIPGEWDY